jgi:hypothetical protein
MAFEFGFCEIANLEKFSKPGLFGTRTIRFYIAGNTTLTDTFVGIKTFKIITITHTRYDLT